SSMSWRSAFMGVLPVVPAEAGDAVSGVAPGGGLTALQQRGDLVVGEVGQVAVDDRAPLLRRQRPEGAVKVRVGELRAGNDPGLPLGDRAGRYRHPGPDADLIHGLVVGDRHQPAPD